MAGKKKILIGIALGILFTIVIQFFPLGFLFTLIAVIVAGGGHEYISLVSPGSGARAYAILGPACLFPVIGAYMLGEEGLLIGAVVGFLWISILNLPWRRDLDEAMQEEWRWGF